MIRDISLNPCSYFCSYFPQLLVCFFFFPQKNIVATLGDLNNFYSFSLLIPLKEKFINFSLVFSSQKQATSYIILSERPRFCNFTIKIILICKRSRTLGLLCIWCICHFTYVWECTSGAVGAGPCNLVSQS